VSDTAIASYNIDGLEQLLKALNEKQPRCRVGIINDKANRANSKSNNAEIGVAHEFGTEKKGKGIPPRSFLRVPITNNLQKEMERSGLFDKQVLRDVVMQGSVKPWLEKVAACAVACVDDAFAQSGPGWPAWKDPNYSNNTGMLLIDTHRLRDSITAEVK
jgi:phage gpG-like protein